MGLELMSSKDHPIFSIFFISRIFLWYIYKCIYHIHHIIHHIHIHICILGFFLFKPLNIQYFKVCSDCCIICNSLELKSPISGTYVLTLIVVGFFKCFIIFHVNLSSVGAAFCENLTLSCRVKFAVAEAVLNLPLPEFYGIPSSGQVFM